jgi:hypothetical protein
VFSVAKTARREETMLAQSRRSTWIWLAVVLFVLPLLAALSFDHAAAAAPAKRGPFFDAPSEAAEFIGYNRSIELAPAQKKLRDRALAAIPAPCCKKFSAATCCCPCNLAKSVWGLSNYLIVRRDANVPEIQKSVRGWIEFVNQSGFTGDACDTAGGCARKFSDNGCGGMDEKNLLAAR